MSFRKTVIVLAALLVAAVLMAALAPRPAPGAAESTARVERGRYLVASIGCADCHAPKTVGADGPEPDMTRFLSGHPEGAALPAPPQLPAGPWIAVASGDLTAWSGPWGVSYPSNLTPDPKTGIGTWSEKDIVTTIRTGRRPDGYQLLPPMPWQNFIQLSDADAYAIAAYLRSIPAIEHKVPDDLPPSDTLHGRFVEFPPPPAWDMPGTEPNR